MKFIGGCFLVYMAYSAAVYGPPELKVIVLVAGILIASLFDTGPKNLLTTADKIKSNDKEEV